MLDVTSQLTNLLTRGGTLEQRAKLTANDVLLLPQFDGGLELHDFARMSETIQTGTTPSCRTARSSSGLR